MKKWTRRAGARPDELARAALELCAERGVQATKVADVAARAGVTVGTVYRYFKTKDELIDAALGQANSPAPRPDTGDRPGTALPALADQLRRWGIYFRTAGSRAVRVSLSDPRRGRGALPSVVRSAIADIESIVANAITRGEMRSDLAAPSVARALIGALLMAPALDNTPSDADDEINVILAVATRGLRADGPSWRPTS